MLKTLAAGGRRAAALRCVTCTSIHELNAGGLSAPPYTSCKVEVSVQASSTADQHRNPLCRHFSVDFPATLGIDPDKVDEPGEQQEIDENHFHRTADLTLGELLQNVNSFLEQRGQDGAAMRVDMTEGKLQIQLGEGRGLLVSKDPEARQLHTSGLAGDVSYALTEDSSGVLQTSGTEGPRWAAVDGGRDLHEVIEEELETATGKAADLEPEPRSGYGPDPT